MYNQYDYEVKLSSCSAYLQVLRNIGASKNLFVHGHGEFDNLKNIFK